MCMWVWVCMWNSFFISKKLISRGDTNGIARYGYPSCSKINASSRDTVEKMGECFFRLNRMSAGARGEEKAVEKREHRNKWPIDPKHRVAGMLARSLWDEDCRFCEILNRYGSATPVGPRAATTRAVFSFYTRIPTIRCSNVSGFN